MQESASTSWDQEVIEADFWTVRSEHSPFSGFRKTEALLLEWKNVHEDPNPLPVTRNGRSFDLPILHDPSPDYPPGFGRVRGLLKCDPSLDRPGLEFPGFIGAAGRFGCRDLQARSVPCNRSRRGVGPRCGI